jgi:transglutaminase-like putative cysteine protease
VRSIAEKARDILGWGIEDSARWKVTFAVAPVAGGPDGGRQALFNQMTAFRAGGEAGTSLRDAASGFTFGNAVTLRQLTGAGEAAAFSFEPAPAGRKASGDAASFSFGELPKQAGIPVLKIEAVVPVRAFSASIPDAPVDIRALTRPTKAWPSDDPEFSRLAAPLSSAPPPVRMERILGLTRQKIHSTREGQGTRYGAAEALARGKGHCWDFSDIYITLARAAGLPARQVGGWVADMSGHVWAEVFIDGRGWIAVDPTTTWTGISARYVPLWQSEDGAGPDFVWWSPPRLERR